jgi:uracil-DNA glycosylase family 4
MTDKEVQTLDRIRHILKSGSWLADQIIFEVEREIDQYYDPPYADVVRACTSCALHTTCKQRVPGVGPMPADIMFVGEGPGENEDDQGSPFVGPSGEMLDKIMAAIGWSREDIYITNVLKCRTDETNRQPTKAEVASCYQHLKKEMELVKPKVIVCWGSVASNVLIHPDFKITQEHGVWFENDNVRLIAAFHPAYILRLGEGTHKEYEAKMRVWDAVQKVKRFQEAGFVDELGS